MVGSYLEDGWRVTGTFHHRPPDRAAIPGRLAFTQLCLDDQESIHRLTVTEQPDVIAHLAGQSSTSRSWIRPSETYRDNVLAQASLLEAAASLSSPPRILVVGSSDEYGAPTELEGPLTETHPLDPVSPYGVSKVAQDLMGRQYYLSHGLPVVRVRPFLQIGPGRSDTFFSGSFARQIVEIEMARRRPVVEVGDIDILRDMTDVRDVDRACRLVIEKGDAGDVYNIASGRPRPLRDLLDAMLDVAGVDAQVRTSPSRRRGVESRALFGDASKLRRKTGWQPSVSLRESALDMIEDWRARLKGG